MTKSNFYKKNARSLTTLIALLLIVAVFSLLSDRYFQYDNLIDIVNQGVINGFLACGITIAIITGGIDLSVGSTEAVVIVACAECSSHGVPVIPTVAFGLLIGAIIGMITDLIIPDALIKDLGVIAEVKNGSWGDTLKVDIEVGNNWYEAK